MEIKNWRMVPILVAGYDIRRWENPHVSAIYVPEYFKKLLFLIKYYIKNCQPFGPTHLQYHSPFGFLITWPLCFHFWYQFKEQQVNSDGLKIPGSEKVLYFRAGARWDVGSNCYQFPSFYAGLLWD